MFNIHWLVLLPCLLSSAEAGRGDFLFLLLEVLNMYFLFTFTDPKPTSGFLFICIGDGCTGGDYVLMVLSILFTICCCLCCHKLRGNAEEDRQATDIPLAEVFSPQDQENLRIMKQQMEEVKDHKAANVHLAGPSINRQSTGEGHCRLF